MVEWNIIELNNKQTNKYTIFKILGYIFSFVVLRSCTEDKQFGIIMFSSLFVLCFSQIHTYAPHPCALRSKVFSLQRATTAFTRHLFKAVVSEAQWYSHLLFVTTSFTDSCLSKTGDRTPISYLRGERSTNWMTL